MANRIANLRRLLACFTALLALAGCGGGSGGGGQATGILGVSVTDTPACGFDAVNITIERVRVHQSATAGDGDGGWSEIVLDPPRKIDLLALTNGILHSLGQTELPAGHYTQLRLVLDSNTAQKIANSVVLSGSTAQTPLTAPSATQSGLKLINGFDVPVGRRVDLVLDFNACKSVVATGDGGYVLMPVISTIPTAVNGVEGYVDKTLLGSNVTVSAQSCGVIARSTVPDPQTGAFVLSRLVAGTYDVVVTADNHATAVIGSVPVANSTMTMVSTNGAPIGLPGSPSRTVSGAAVLDPKASAVATYVAARQSFTKCPSVTVKQVPAQLATGAYSLALPTAAPMFGQFGTGVLPIAMTAQTAAAGKYKIEAAASGYQPESANIDISSANATQSFSLGPAVP